MYACDLLVGLAEFPWVVGHRPLGTLPFTLGSLSEYPWVLPVCSLLAFCLLLACRDARMRLYRVEASFSFCLSPCLPGRGTPRLYREVAFPRVAAWLLYRVGSLLGAASLWSSSVGTVIHSSSQGKSPGAARLSAPGCLVVCCSICQACRLSLPFRLWRRSVPRLHRRDSLFAAVCRDAFSRLGQLACGGSAHP